MVFEVLIDLLLFVGGFLAGYRGLLRMRSGGGARKVLDGVRVGAGPFRSAVVRDLPPPDAENPACGRCDGAGLQARPGTPRCSRLRWSPRR